MGRANPATPVAIDSIRFTVGRDAGGCWVVCDRDGLVGGLFRDRASAVHFAMFESDHTPGAVCCVPDGVITRRMQDSIPSPASSHGGDRSSDKRGH